MTVTLITGANKGLGYETARQLIERGHCVYLGARNPERGKEAASELLAPMSSPHQASSPSPSWKVPVGPSLPMVAMRTMTSAPFSTG